MTTPNPASHEPNPDPQALTSNPGNNSSTGVDYEPHPESSIPLSPERQKIIDSITSLYSGSASESDMQVRPYHLHSALFSMTVHESC